MNLAIMQPYLFPYIGYFQLIKSVDVFILYDDVNFRKQSWINRNKISLNGSEHFFTLPCKGISSHKKINEIELNNLNAFKNDFFKLLEHSYASKSPFYIETIALLNSIFDCKDYKTISEFNFYSLIQICKYLKIDTEIKKSSECLGHTEPLKREQRIYAICDHFNASTYINAKGGDVLYDKSEFSNNKIELTFLSSIESEIKYKQVKSVSFMPWLSIIDILMNNSIQQSQSFLNSYKLN